MDQSAELKQCFDKLEKLRANFLQTNENRHEDLRNTVAEMAQEQLSSLETINDFFRKFSTNSVVKERLEFNQNSIVMPERDSVSNLIKCTKAALQIHQEIALTSKSASVPDKKFFDGLKTNANKFTSYDLNNRDFNRCFRNTVRYHSSVPEAEELGDSTVNTIVSEDVLASSPI